VENKINNINVYLERMEKGMVDKLWWVDKIHPKKIVDFGCADGTMLKHLTEMGLDVELIGVDIDNEMCRRAKENVPSARIMSLVEFMDSTEDFSDALLVLSSVIHEIYSYELEPEDEIQALYNKGFKYIAIRDMFLSETEVQDTVSNHDYTYVINYSKENQLRDFENFWGHINTVRNLSHFLLKYTYEENWHRELRENYLPIDLEPFIKNIPSIYRVEYVEHYCNPYIQRRVWNDFFIKFNYKTHAKLLLVRK
jgi:ribosomal protein L11 methylase PrmA